MLGCLERKSCTVAQVRKSEELSPREPSERVGDDACQPVHMFAHVFFFTAGIVPEGNENAVES